MTFRASVLRLAERLGQVVVEGPPDSLSVAEFDTALAARREVLACLRRVLGDVIRDGAGPVRTTGTPHTAGFLRELAAQPPVLLLRQLIDHPAPRPDQHFADDPRPAPDTPLGRAWEQVGIWAQIAHHRWHTDRPRPDGDARWSAVADVAALAETLAVLDTDLLAALGRSPGIDPDLATAFAHVSFSGLHIAAAETAALARAGPLPAWGTPSTPAAVSILMVRAPTDLIAAQQRIAAQIRDSAHLSPATVTRIAIGQTRFLTATANALEPAIPQAATAVLGLADDIASALTGQNTVAALTGDDDLRPIHQTRELLTGTTAALRADPPHAVLLRATQSSPRILTALADHVHQAVRDGRWLVLNAHAEHETDLLWVRARPREPLPLFCRHLAAVAGRALARIPTTSELAPTSAVSPQTVLAGVSALRHRSRRAHPADRGLILRKGRNR